METPQPDRKRSSARQRANAIKDFRCKNLIAVIEDPVDIKNIGTVIRNANALGVEKVYVVDPRGALPDDWHDMREKKSLSKTSVSAVKWTFVKRFDSNYPPPGGVVSGRDGTLNGLKGSCACKASGIHNGA